MPIKCCIPNCKVESDDAIGRALTFHQIPGNATERQKWMESIKDNFKFQIEEKKYMYVCRLHFDASCFYYTSLYKNRRLKKGLYPTKFSNLKELIESVKCMNESEPNQSQLFNIDDKTLSEQDTKNFSISQTSKSSFNQPCNHENKEQENQSKEMSKCLEDVTSLIENDDNYGIGVSECSITNGNSTGFNVSETIPQSSKKKSILNINVDSIDFSDENWAKMKNIVQEAKREVFHLRQKNKALAMKVYRSKKGIKNVTSLLSHMKRRKYISQKLFEVLEEIVPNSVKDLFKQLLHRPKVTKFPSSLRTFATTLHFYSPKAYDYIRHSFMESLLHSVTIRKWFQTIPCSSGINDLSIETIKRKVDLERKHKNKRILCNIAMDEMKIKKQIEIIQGNEYGYVDIVRNKDRDNSQEAENVLVLMLVSIHGKWKIPISFYFVNALSGKEKAEIIKQNLLALNATGVVVTSVTFDGLQSNLTMCKELGAEIQSESLEERYFLHLTTKERIFIICDGCHMLKLIRNCIATNEIYDSDGNIISWKYFKNLVDYQELNGVHAGTKIRRQHINWIDNKMNVKLAAQTLSESVSIALDFLENTEDLIDFKGAHGTANFSSVINDAFDILNSRNQFHKNKSKIGISDSNIQEIVNKIKETTDYIKNLRLKDGTLVIMSRKKTGFVGLIISLRSVLDIYNTYVKNNDEYLLTYKLSQDHLENFFSAVRSKGGHSNNPTCYQFIQIFKKLLVHADIKESENSNCISLDDTKLLQVSPDKMNTHLNADKHFINNENDSTAINNEDFFTSENHFEDACFYGKGTDKSYINNVVAYIAGFVIRSILKTIKCLQCPLLLTSEISHSTLLRKKNRGGLIAASTNLIELCKYVEMMFRKCYKSKQGAFKQLFSKIRIAIPDNFLTINHTENPLEHRSFLLNKIVFTYLRIRIHYYETQKTKSSKKVRRIYTKLILFRNE